MSVIYKLSVLLIGVFIITLPASAKDESGRNGFWKQAAQGSPDLASAKAKLDKNPADAIANNDYGWALRQNRKLTEAVTYLQKAIALRPTLAQAHSNLSVTYLDLGKQPEAQQEAQKAVVLDAKQPIYYVVLGNALAAGKEYSAAEGQYRKAMALRPDYENAHYNLGRVLKLDNQGSEAQTELSIALQLDPKDDRVVELLDQLMGHQAVAGK